MKFSSYWDVGVYNTQFKAKCDWGVAPLPVVDENNRYKQCFGINSGYRIARSAVEKYGEEKIMIAYNWMYSDEFLSELFEQGCYLSCYKDVLNNTALGEDSPKGWQEYAEILKDSILTPVVPKTDTTGKPALSDNFLNQVWYGKMTLDEALVTETKTKNDGITKYKEIHPEYDDSDTLIADWFEMAKVGQ